MTPSSYTSTVAFLMSDIEGSTRIAAATGEAFPRLLDEHYELLANAIGRAGGSVVSTEGDAVFAVFPSAREAATAAIEAQRALAAHEWPIGGEIRVRIGVHAGEATVHDGRYAGIDIHRAARITAAGWGDQILASESARALSGDTLPAGATFRDLGLHNLKDFPAAEHLYQLVAPGLPADFPPPRAPAREVPTNLPRSLTRFIGRRRELDELQALLATERLVTLTGPGGTGKTRLSVEGARSLFDRFPDGIWFIALHAVRDPDLVMPTIAQTLGVREVPGREPADLVAERLRNGFSLLVLDNVEQVVEAAPDIAALLQATTAVSILTSSREPLRLEGERIYPVPPLDTPAESAPPTAAALRGSPSIELFVDRARATRPGFELTDDNAAAVAAICRRLDGLPLAIELAAARVNLLRPRQILERLERRLGLLASARRDLPERQRTLRAAIDWSHDLLPESQRALFRRFAVFAGGAELDAVQAVVDPDRKLAPDVLDLAAALVERSLMMSTDDNADVRLGMLETIREYAAERLTATDEAASVQERHASYYRAIAEAVSVPMPDSRRNELFVRLDRELGNIRAAIRWSLDSGQTDDALRLATALGDFWHIRNHVAEGIATLDELIAASAHQGATALRARAISVAAGLLTWQADAERSRALARRGIRMAEDVGDMATVALAKSGLAWSTFFSDPMNALPSLEDATAAARAVGADNLVIETVSGQAWTHLRLGRLEDAQRCAAEVIAVGERTGEEYMTTFSLVVLGLIAGMRGNGDEQMRRYAEALRRSRAAGAPVGTALSLEAIAHAALDRGDVARGIRLAAAARRMRDESTTGATLDQLGIEGPLERARALVDDTVYESAVEEGSALPAEDAAAAAIERY